MNSRTAHKYSRNTSLALETSGACIHVLIMFQMALRLNPKLVPGGMHVLMMFLWVKNYETYEADA